MFTRKGWRQPQLLSEAFVRRPSEEGLSVCVECTVDQCMVISAMSKTYGAADLLAQAALDLGLTIQADSINHAEIRGVPSKEDDSVRAEFLASKLANAARIIDTEYRERPAIANEP